MPMNPALMSQYIQTLMSRGMSEQQATQMAMQRMNGAGGGGGISPGAPQPAAAVPAGPGPTGGSLPMGTGGQPASPVNNGGVPPAGPIQKPPMPPPGAPGQPPPPGGVVPTGATYQSIMGQQAGLNPPTTPAASGGTFPSPVPQLTSSSPNEGIKPMQMVTSSPGEGVGANPFAGPSGSVNAFAGSGSYSDPGGGTFPAPGAQPAPGMVSSSPFEGVKPPQMVTSSPTEGIKKS